MRLTNLCKYGLDTKNCLLTVECCILRTMGSSPSKEKSGTVITSVTDAKTAVANVNNESQSATASTALIIVTEKPAQKTFVTQEDAFLDDQTNRIKSRNVSPKDEQTFPTRFLWKADKESQRELDEMLQPPGSKRQSKTAENTVDSVMSEDLPETYAQRHQREQYTRNQQIQLHQKTLQRSPENWRETEAEEVKAETSGFDPSKFRSVNQRMAMKGIVFTSNTSSGEAMQFTYGQQNIDDIDVEPQQPNKSRELPVYNASELDLMASLERELM